MSFVGIQVAVRARKWRVRREVMAEMESAFLTAPESPRPIPKRSV